MYNLMYYNACVVAQKYTPHLAILDIIIAI